MYSWHNIIQKVLVTDWQQVSSLNCEATILLLAWSPWLLPQGKKNCDRQPGLSHVFRGEVHVVISAVPKWRLLGGCTMPHVPSMAGGSSLLHGESPMPQTGQEELIPHYPSPYTVNLMVPLLSSITVGVRDGFVILAHFPSRALLLSCALLAQFLVVYVAVYIQHYPLCLTRGPGLFWVCLVISCCCQLENL